MTCELPTWIQTITGIVLALVTSLTLIVLWGYAADTKIIAKNSSEQIENSQMPFVTLIKAIGFSDPDTWKLKNQGFGPAINVRYTHDEDSDNAARMGAVNSLATGEPPYPLPGEIGNLEKRDSFAVEYESLSGRKYRTTVTWPNGEMKVAFRKIN